MKILSKLRNNIDLLVVFFLVFLITSFFSSLGVDPHHDGAIFKPARDVLEGKILFKETFVHHGALATYINAFFLLLFGKYLLTLRLATAFFYSLTAVLLLMIYEKFLNKKLLYLSIGLWILLAPYYVQIFLPWPSVYSTFFLTLSIYIFLFSLKKSKSEIILKHTQIFLLGIASSLAFWAKQPYLVLVLFLSLFYFSLYFLKLISFKKMLKAVIVLLGGFLFISSIFMIILISTFSLNDWFLQTIRTGYAMGRIVGQTYNLIDVLKYFSSNQIWILLPLTCFGFLIGNIFSPKHYLSKLKSLQLFGISLIGTSSFLQYYPIYDYSHAYWAITPAIGLFIYILSSLNILKRLKNIKRVSSYQNLYTCFIIVLIICVSYFIFNEVKFRLKIGLNRVQTNNVEMKLPSILRGMKVRKGDAIFFEEVAVNMSKYFNNNSNKRFIVVGPDALYSAFANNEINVGPFYANYSGYTSGFYSYDAMINKFIKRYKPLVLADRSDLFKSEYFALKIWKDRNVVLLAPLENGINK